jgi:hypothetical protein
VKPNLLEFSRDVFGYEAKMKEKQKKELQYLPKKPD